MSELKIGSRVLCTGLVSFRYDEDGEKLPEIDPIPGGLEFIYVGNKIRYSGTRLDAAYYTSFEGTEYEPPAWVAKKRYTVYQIRIDANSRILEALPESITLIEDDI